MPNGAEATRGGRPERTYAAICDGQSDRAHRDVRSSHRFRRLDPLLVVQEAEAMIRAIPAVAVEPADTTILEQEDIRPVFSVELLRIVDGARTEPKVPPVPDQHEGRRPMFDWD